MTYYKSKNELELEEARKAQNRKIRELEEENQKLKKEKQELEYLWDINEELKEENKKLKENRSIEIKTCNRYREKCEEYGKEITQLKIDLSNAEMNTRCWEKVAKWID